MATVYNTLAVLEKLGFVRALKFDPQQNRYETNPAPHVNMICRACGKIVESADGARLLEDAARLQGDFQVTDCHMEIYGLCTFCRSHA